jgi:hypothetical protein
LAPARLAFELLLAQLGIERAEKHEGGAGVVVDGLGVDVLRGEAHAEARAGGGAGDFLRIRQRRFWRRCGFANGVHGMDPESSADWR